MNRSKFSSTLVTAAIGIAMLAAPTLASAQTILKPADTEKLLPPRVFYRGQSASTQLRNSTGVKFDDGFYVLASLVDTSGYSTSVAAKYQAYFIAEVPIAIGGQKLPAGVYGIGFIAGNQFAVTDIGAHDVLTVTSTTDNDIKRPMPLQILPDAANGFRLYAGRQYVVFQR